MEKMNRRQFNRFVVAGTTVAVLGIPAGRAFAQSKPVLYSLRRQPTDSEDNNEVVIDTTDTENDKVQQQSQRQLSGNTPLTILSRERIGGFTTLPTGSLLISRIEGIPGEPTIVSRLTMSNPSSQSLTVTGLEENSTVESLAPSDGSILAIISLNRGIPPFRLATLDSKTGQAQMIKGFNFPATERVGNLTQCPDGTFYMTALSAEGSTRLVQLDLQNQKIINLATLRLGKRTLSSDLKSLACSGTGQLFALADVEERDKNLLLKINISTGELTPVQAIDAEKITFSRS
jgi:hypothetical protein